MTAKLMYLQLQSSSGNTDSLVSEPLRSFAAFPKFCNLFWKLYNSKLEITAIFVKDEKVSCFHIGCPVHWFFHRCNNPYSLLYGKACEHEYELRVNKQMLKVPF